MRQPAAPPSANRNQRVWQVVAQIPRGCVMTYAQVARAAAVPGPSGPRQVGYALAALAAGSTVPWQRVVNAAGRISVRDTEGGHTQRSLLEEEGVEFDLNGKLDLARFGWQP